MDHETSLRADRQIQDDSHKVYGLPQEENCGNRLSFFICYIFRFAFE